MNSFIKRNQKKILAIFSAGLMISFGLADYVRNPERASTVGMAGRTKITNKDVAAVRAEWEELKRMVRLASDGEKMVRVPLLVHQFARGVGPSNAQEIYGVLDANPELYLLLIREAEAMGTVVSNDDVLDEYKNTEHPEEGPTFSEDGAKDAIRDLLMVTNAADNAANAVKISRPYRDLNMANQQMMSLNLVEFKAENYLDKLSAWTAEEKAAKVKEQFERYKNQEPTTRPANEFSFGYRVPNKVRVQYVGLPANLVKKVVTAKMEADKRTVEVEARKYYRQNLASFPAPLGVKPPPWIAAATQPTTQPSTKPVSKPKANDVPEIFRVRNPSMSSASTQPAQSTRFDEFRDEIMERLTNDRINKLTNEVASYLNTQMATDFASFKASLMGGNGNPTTGPSIAADVLEKVPASALAVRYDGFEYLQKLADSAETKFGIRPIIQNDLAMRTEKQLADEGDISKATVSGTDLLDIFRQLQQSGRDFQSAFQAAQQMSQQIGKYGEFPGYASRFVAALASPDIQAISRQVPPLRVLSLYEPSPLMHSTDLTEGKNYFFFRIITAEPAHPPDLKDVEAQVFADARLAAAQKLAADAAQKLVNNAIALNSHLSSVAPAAGKTLITTGLFSAQRPVVTKYDIPPGTAQGVLVTQALETLLHATVPHPIGVIDFKPTNTVLAAEVNQIQPTWTPEEFPVNQLESLASVQRSTEARMRMTWFNGDDIAARNHYVSYGNKKK